MKRVLFVAMIAMLFTACGNDKKSTDKPESTVAVKSIATPVDENAKKIEDLKKLPQLTLDQIRVLLPHELDSAKEKNYAASTQFGYGLASVEYPKKSKAVKVTLYDCAGELGSANYFENYWNNLNVTKETEQEYTKTIDFMGGKAVESYKKDLRLSTLAFVVRDRLVIIVEGKNMQPSELEETAKKLRDRIAK
jgi:acyl-CoA synthetase (AMP-forming)/AMP-acid ligase II